MLKFRFEHYEIEYENHECFSYLEPSIYFHTYTYVCMECNDRIQQINCGPMLNMMKTGTRDFRI